ncbi:unnamed protein product [Lathyrus oleraceus]
MARILCSFALIMFVFLFLVVFINNIAAIPCLLSNDCPGDLCLPHLTPKCINLFCQCYLENGEYVIEKKNSRIKLQYTHYAQTNEP